MAMTSPVRAAWLPHSHWDREWSEPCEVVKRAVTLLRAVGINAKPTFPTRPIWAGPSNPAPEGQSQGTYRISFGINLSAKAENLIRDHERCATPVLEIEAQGGG